MSVTTNQTFNSMTPSWTSYHSLPSYLIYSLCQFEQYDMLIEVGVPANHGFSSWTLLLDTWLEKNQTCNSRVCNYIISNGIQQGEIRKMDTLLGTNISLSKILLKDDCPFPKVRYVSSLAGKWIHNYFLFQISHFHVVFLLEVSIHSIPRPSHQGLGKGPLPQEMPPGKLITSTFKELFVALLVVWYERIEAKCDRSVLSYCCTAAI